MSKAAMRIALKAILRALDAGRNAEASEMLAELIDSLGDEPRPRNGAAKTGAQRTAEWRARQEEEASQSDVTVTSQASLQNGDLSSLSESSAKLSEHEEASKEPEFQALTSLQLISESKQDARDAPTCDVKTKKAKLRHVTPRDDVSVVYGHWLTVMAKGPGTKLTKQRKAKIEARLREGYSVGDLKAAIDGCRLSEWHMGANDSAQPYNDVESILLNGGRVEKHIERLAAGRPARSLNGRTAQPSTLEAFERQQAEERSVS